MKLDDVKRYLDKAIQMRQLPEEETEVISISLENEVLDLLNETANQWHCTANDIIVATLMAIRDMDPKELSALLK